MQANLCSSKLLDKRWKKKDKEIHQQKLREVKSQVRDQLAVVQLPKNQQGIRNGKKEALLEQRFTEIERENRILLEKMSNIMQKGKPSLYSQPGLPPKKSLNRERRRRDLIKITLENQAFLKRLQQKSATYSVEQWETDFARQTKYREMVCENPYEFGNYNKTRLLTAQGRGRLDYLLTGEGQTGSAALPRIGSVTSAQNYTAQQFLNNNKSQYQSLKAIQQRNQSQGGTRGMPVIRQTDGLDENRIVLYRKGKNLGQGFYIVEISSDNSRLFIAAYDVESPESLLIELRDKRAQDILKEFENDYESMASCLQVINKRLILTRKEDKKEEEKKE